MIQIDNLSNEASQVTHVALEDGTVVDLELVYDAAVQRWFFNLTYGARVINGVAVTTFPNILREWRDILKFGLACATIDGIDPVSQDDFSSGRAQLFILNSDDVVGVERDLLGTT